VVEPKISPDDVSTTSWSSAKAFASFGTRKLIGSRRAAKSSETSPTSALSTSGSS
jgi:hypothetical protein